MITNFYNRTMDVERDILSSDDAGSTTRSWVTVMNDVPCRLEIQTGSQAVDKGARIDFPRTYVVYCDIPGLNYFDILFTGGSYGYGYDAFIQEFTDRLVIDSKTYIVDCVRTIERRTTAHHLEIDVKLVEGYE